MNDENINRKIFVDLDGVLADFDKAFYDISKMTPEETVNDQEMWLKIDSYGKEKFFSEMDWMIDGKELWNFIINNFLRVKILSSLGRSNKETSQGKMNWLHHNIPSLQTNDIIFVNNKHQKKRYSKPGAGYIIVDDTPLVIDEWNQTGGIGILHKNSNETISKLREYV